MSDEKKPSIWIPYICSIVLMGCVGLGHCTNTKLRKANTELLALLEADVQKFKEYDAIAADALAQVQRADKAIAATNALLMKCHCKTYDGGGE